MPATVVALPTPDRRAEAANEALRWLTIEHLRTIRDETRPTTQRPKDQAQRRWRAQAGAARARDDRPARGGGAEA
jgi:hypothetical protein